MKSWNNEQVSQAVQQVSEKAAVDAGFRELCKQDIHTAVFEATGMHVPKNVKIQVVDATGYHLTVSLPPLQQPNNELEESELEQVAGGNKNLDFEPRDPGPKPYKPSI